MTRPRLNGGSEPGDLQWPSGAQATAMGKGAGGLYISI
jgi:hypothetical protein